MANDDVKSPNSAFDDPADAWLAKSLQQLPQVQVPSNFLPSVMFKVYEKHSRNLISWPRLGIYSGILLLGSLGFFFLDVLDHMASTGEASFTRAVSQLMEQAFSGSQQIVADLGGLTMAAWQITLGAISAFFTQTSLLIQILVFLVVVCLFFLFKKGWSRLA
jgi:hypothetical protein